MSNKKEIGVIVVLTSQAFRKVIPQSVILDSTLLDVVFNRLPLVSRTFPNHGEMDWQES